jgi:hypothetical protein
MKDLYKQLGISDSSGEGEIRAALAGAGGELREAAQYILLDPSRRAKYDRNRRVLLTVGHLRAHLGLNLTRFWPRSRFADFTTDLNPGSLPGGARRITPMTMAWALGVSGPADGKANGRGARRRSGRALDAPWRRAFIAAGLAVAAAVSLALWYWRQALLR